MRRAVECLSWDPVQESGCNKGTTTGTDTAVVDEAKGMNNNNRMGHSVICLNLPQRPVVWTSRSSSKYSFIITALLAFAFGIGVGIFIPFYLLPPSLSSISSSDGGEYDVIGGQFALTPQSVIDPVVDPVDKRTLYISEYLASTTASYENNRNNNQVRFGRVSTTTERTRSLSRDRPAGSPMSSYYRRPTSPSVKFIVPDVRVLSLDPVRHEDPPSVRLNLTSLRSNSDELPTRVPATVANHNNNDENEELLDGVYWSDKVESKLPKGFNDEDIRSWRRFVQNSVVSSIQEGCGRMQNRMLSLENGTRACCRYRHNFDQIQGEIFGFYLSQILKIRNLAPSALAVIQPFDDKWSGVRQQLNVAQWMNEKPVVMTRFIDSLSQAYIPPPFRGSTRRLHPIDLTVSANAIDSDSDNNKDSSGSAASSSSLDIKELAQWSDLIVFDYLTANLDRMVNNLYNLQWNPSMMEAPAHNLAKDSKSGLLIFLDNESGLLHGYRLLDKYEQYHRVMLDSLCVFRKSTAEVIKRLHKERNVGQLLKSMFQNLEPALTNYLPTIPDKSIKILNHRIDRVYDQITKCESLYMSSSSNTQL